MLTFKNYLTQVFLDSEQCIHEAFAEEWWFGHQTHEHLRKESAFARAWLLFFFYFNFSEHDVILEKKKEQFCEHL